MGKAGIALLSLACAQICRAEDPPRGSLQVEASEVGAEVFLDGKDTGRKSPVTLEGLLPGDYEVGVQLGSRSATGMAHVQAGQPAGLHLHLSRPSLYIESAPPGAQVRIDGVLKGAAPLEVPSPAEREMTVELSYPGYQTSTVTASESDGRLRVELEPAKWAFTWSILWPQVEVGRRVADRTWLGVRAAGLQLGMEPTGCSWAVGVFGAGALLVHQRFDSPEDFFGFEVYAGPSVLAATHSPASARSTFGFCGSQTDPFFGGVLGLAGRVGPVELEVELHSGVFGKEFSAFIVPTFVMRHTF